MTKETIGRVGLGFAAWAATATTALAQLSPRPFAVAGGEGGGGGAGGVTGWLMGEQSWLTHLIAAKVHALHGQPSAAWRHGRAGGRVRTHAHARSCSA